MRIGRRIASTVATIWVIAGLAGSARAEPLRIGYNIWVGLGPLFVAKEKGFFAEEGVEVELIGMEIPEALYSGLLAGQLDANIVTIDTVVPHFDPEQPYACVMVTDESLGADGILATRDIQTIADLRGKMVAVPHGSVAQFYLNVLLKKAGLTQGDLEVVDLPAEDADNAFLMGEVDAAVTWEPWLTQGRQAAHGHVLAVSSETPGLIVDCLLTKPEVLDDRLTEFKALARAWDAAVHYAEAHPDQANEIMGQKRWWVAGGPGGLRRHPEGRPVL